MPPKKRTPIMGKKSVKKRTLPKKRISKKSVDSSVFTDEVVCIPVSLDTVSESRGEPIAVTPILIPEKSSTIERHHAHITQAVFLSVGFMVLFTTFLFVSTKMKAQDYSASVSAVVAATPFNTKPKPQPTWWDKIDLLTKLYVGTGVVGAFVVGLGALTLLPKKKKRSHNMI